MFEIGAQVRIKPPFSFYFRDVYTVVEKVITEDNQVVYFLEGIDGGFSPIYLEVIEVV